MKTITLDVLDGSLVASFNYDPELVAIVKEFSVRKYNKVKKVWMIPRSKYYLSKFIDHLNQNNLKVNVTVDIRNFIAKESVKRNQRLTLKKTIPTTVPKLKYPLRDYQKIAYNYGKIIKRCFLADQMGLGKAQPIISDILTPSKWTKLKDILIGTEIINKEGGISHVTGYFPQGIKDVYKVTFGDGMSTMCCEEHLWDVRTVDMRWRNSPYITKPLKDIKTNLFMSTKNRKNARYSIPIIEPVKFPYRKVPIHPYLLGVLIGDGCIKYEVHFSTQGTEILEKVKKLIPSDMQVKRKSGYDYSIISKGGWKINALKHILKQLNLFGLGSKDKFIPNAYKFNSINNRIKILQGLMDTDGYISKNGTIQFTTISKRLSEDIKFIVQSLGGVARLSTKIPQINGQMYNKAYTWTIKLPPNIVPFTLQRKLSRLRSNRKYLPCRTIRKVEYVGRMETACISTDAPDKLYVTNDFIVTHNTVEALSIVSNIRTLIVTPATLKWNWYKEIKKFLGEEAQVIATAKDKISKKNFVIISYDLLKKKKQELLNTDFQAAIADESHFIKNRKTARYKAVKKVFEDIEYILLLTGTPMLNRPAELFTQLNLLSSREFPKYWDFVQSYCNPKLTPFGWDVRGADNLDELKYRIEPFMIRRLKSEVAKELPDKIIEDITIELSTEVLREYLEAETEFVNWYTSGNRDTSIAMTRAHKLKQIANKEKKQRLIEMVDELVDNNERVVAFSQYRTFIDNFEQEYNRKILKITGKVPQEDRMFVVEQFGEISPTLLIGTTQCMGYGLNLQAASYCIFVDLLWTPLQHRQCEDRLHRIGQTKKVIVYRLIAKNTIDEEIAKRLADKEQIINYIMEKDPTKIDKIQGESVFEEVMRKLKQKYQKKIKGDH